MDRVNYLHDVPTHSLGSNNTYLHEGMLQFMYKRYGVYHFIVKLLSDGWLYGLYCMFEGKHSPYNICTFKTNVAIQIDRMNYLHDVPTHSLGSENTYLHEGVSQFMYKRYSAHHFIVKRGPL